MAVSFRGFGTASAGSTSVAPTINGTVAAGDLTFLMLACKYPGVVPAPPVGWTLLGQYQGGSGVSGADSGDVLVQVWYRVEVGTGGAQTVTLTGGNSALARCMTLRSTLVPLGGHSWGLSKAGGADSTPGTAWSVTCDVDPELVAGDLVLAFSGCNTDLVSGSAGQWSSVVLTVPGATTTTTQPANAWTATSNTTTGDDCAVNLSFFSVDSGASSGVPVLTQTAGASNANGPCGATIVFRVRELPLVTATAAVTLDDVTLSAFGTTVATADLAVTLDDVTLSATAFVPATGDLAVTLDDVTLDATAFTPPPPEPELDHVAAALDRLPAQWRGESNGSGLILGRAPAAALAPAPTFEMPVLAEVDHVSAAVDRLPLQWRSDT